MQLKSYYSIDCSSWYFGLRFYIDFYLQVLTVGFEVDLGPINWNVSLKVR
jgi:hypothetical protein